MEPSLPLAAAMIAGGLVLLVASGEALVKGAGGLALKFGVSPLLVGLVIVGFGTSMPEMTTSVQAALSGSPGVAVGNVVGSNIANILLILAVAAIIAPMAVDGRAFGRDGPALAAAMVIVAGALAFLPMGRLTGAALFALLIAYVLASYVIDRRLKDAGAALHASEAQAVAPAARAPVAAAMTLAGLIGVIGGAWLLVTGAVAVAGGLGVSEAVIGLTVVAVGTSLPELAATISAARRGQGGMALGTVVGSNIFNGLGILGAAAMAAPFTVPARMIGLDLWVMLAASAILIGFAVTGWRIDRREGALMLALYIAYTAWLAASAAA
ncbi:calcium/sodium antiporter [Glycocaulis profundi]|nr:calcium/sodium antiporter [Glycocaulis profundi]